MNAPNVRFHCENGEAIDDVYVVWCVFVFTYILYICFGTHISAVVRTRLLLTDMLKMDGARVRGVAYIEKKPNESPHDTLRFMSRESLRWPAKSPRIMSNYIIS